MSVIQFQLRRDTAANWTTANPVLLAGEFGFETNTGAIKIGDGSTAWTSLGYYSTRIRTAAGAPAGSLGVVGDLYLNSTNGDFYLKTGVSAYTLQSNLTGPTGATGPTGPAGGVNTFAGRSGAVSPVQADYDGFFLTPAEGNAAYQPLDPDLTAIAAVASQTAFGQALLAATAASLTAALNAATASLQGAMSPADYTYLQNQRKAWVNILDFGGDKTGVTSSATALTNAQAALPSGGIIWFPPGTYQFGNTLYDLNTAHITLKGSARYNTVFTTTSTTAGIIRRNQYYQTIEDITVTGPGTGQSPTATAGSLLDCNAANSAYGVIRRVTATYAFDAINISDPLSITDENEVRFFKHSGIVVNQNSDHQIEQATMDNNTSFLPTGGGIDVSLTASLLVNSCNIIHSNFALNLNAATGVTIPSVKGVNNFFDTSVVGLNITGAGSVLRCEFTNSWFSSMSSKGVALTPAAGGQADGITFVNCDFYNNIGGTTVGIDTNAQTKKWKVIGSSLAGWTTGINLVAGAGHYPTIEANTIGSVSAFGVNTTGIAVASGAYLGLVITGNDANDNTTPITIAATPTFANYKNFRISNNPGINTGGAQTPPAATPVLTTVYTNTFGYPMLVVVKHGATANTSVTINGAANTLAFVAAQVATYRLEPGDTFAVAGGTAPTVWAWNKQ